MKKNNKERLIYFAVAVVVAAALTALIVGNTGTNPNKTADFSNNLPSNNIVGKNASDFSLPDINGRLIKLGDFRSKNVVLFFNEGEMCYPACWNQIEALASDSRFNSSDTIAFSIVVDSRMQWQKIESDMPQFRNAKILFDTERAVSAKYRVLSLASSMHPGSFPGHTYFIIDKNGIIKFFLDDPMMAIRNDRLAAEINKLKQ